MEGTKKFIEDTGRNNVADFTNYIKHKKESVLCQIDTLIRCRVNGEIK